MVEAKCDLAINGWSAKIGTPSILRSYLNKVKPLYILYCDSIGTTGVLIMPTFYTSKYVQPHELCDKAYYNAANDKAKILWQFNPLVLITVDLLRERFGAVTVNNWKAGGSFQQRGLRTDTSQGAAMSPHKRGAALDCNFKNATAEEIREVMKKVGCFVSGFKDKTNLGVDECFRHIGRIESTQNGKPISWFHFDIWNCQNVDGSIQQLHV